MNQIKSPPAIEAGVATRTEYHVKEFDNGEWEVWEIIKRPTAKLGTKVSWENYLSKRLGCHPSRAEAMDQLYVLIGRKAVSTEVFYREG